MKMSRQYGQRLGVHRNGARRVRADLVVKESSGGELEGQKRGGDQIKAQGKDRPDRDNNRDDRLVIAIDGPAAAGKTTVANELARRIGALLFDTGVIYRALALAALEQGIDPSDAVQLAEIAASLPVRIARPSVEDGRACDVLLSERNVTREIRAPEVDRIVSEVSAHPAVRQALLAPQRAIGRSGRVVMVGRDIGTIVMPDADLKVWLDASLDERARRRTLDLERLGKSASFEQVRADMAARDHVDSQRDVAPMRPAPDALVVMTDGMSIDDVVDRVVELLAEHPVNGAHR